MNTLDLVRACAKCSVAEMPAEISPDIITEIMAANNRLLKAAIIENGGELVISPESFYEIFQNKQHVVAWSDEAGNIRLSLAAKESIEHADFELLPL